MSTDNNLRTFARGEVNAEQFVIWLDGLLTGNHGAQPSEKQWEAIVSRMTEVTKPKFILRTERMSREELARGIQEGDVYDRLAKNGTIPGRMEFVAHMQVAKAPTGYEDITTTLEQYGRTFKINPESIGLSERDLIKGGNPHSFNGPVVIPGVSQ